MININRKLNDLENESRQDNVCFTDFKEGNKETWETSQNIVKNFSKENIGIYGDIDIERAYRTGKIKKDYDMKENYLC